MTHCHNKMIVLSIFMYFFRKNSWKLLVLQKKKNQMSFIFIQKFDEKLSKAKKKSNPACIFLYFHFIFTPFIFFQKNTESYTV
jgi:hypothetical protein